MSKEFRNLNQFIVEEDDYSIVDEEGNEIGSKNGRIKTILTYYFGNKKDIAKEIANTILDPISQKDIRKIAKDLDRDPNEAISMLQGCGLSVERDLDEYDLLDDIEFIDTLDQGMKHYDYDSHDIEHYVSDMIDRCKGCSSDIIDDLEPNKEKWIKWARGITDGKRHKRGLIARKMHGKLDSPWEFAQALYDLMVIG